MSGVLLAVVEAELALFEVEEECAWVNPSEPGQAAFGVAPESLDAVDVIPSYASAVELVPGMIDTQALLVAQVNDPVVAAPAIGADDAVELDLPSYRGRKNCFRAIGHDFGTDLIAAFKAAEDGRLLPCSPNGLVFETPGPEETLVGLDDGPDHALGRHMPQKSAELVL